MRTINKTYEYNNSSWLSILCNICSDNFDRLKYFSDHDAYVLKEDYFHSSENIRSLKSFKKKKKFYHKIISFAFQYFWLSSCRSLQRPFIGFYFTFYLKGTLSKPVSKVYFLICKVNRKSKRWPLYTSSSVMQKLKILKYERESKIIMSGYKWSSLLRDRVLPGDPIFRQHIFSLFILVPCLWSVI